ncbi:hypothetical protein NC652_004849 [Populus alba x Populus x berolinensis]|nr:hypothetical protein NC652_004849 [Populus alba x Populus x berolinensis]
MKSSANGGRQSQFTLCLLLLHFDMASRSNLHSWRPCVAGPFNVSGWPKGKSFKAGGYYLYSITALPAAHNVLSLVNKRWLQFIVTSPRGCPRFTRR